MFDNGVMKLDFVANLPQFEMKPLIIIFNQIFHLVNNCFFLFFFFVKTANLNISDEDESLLSILLASL